ADNLTLSHFRPYSRAGVLNLRRQRRAAEEWTARMNIKVRSVLHPVGSLSGGNQQKIALARLLHQQAGILLLDEPTRGIDVVSKSQIYEWIGQLAWEGKSVIFVSSYFPELLGVCDTIAAFHRGQVVDVRPSADWDDPSLMAAATLGQA
ncbi:MAG TPA: ATP-binding cassette domain-containing protein, partial [Acidobacteriota bacterium]